MPRLAFSRGKDAPWKIWLQSSAFGAPKSFNRVDTGLVVGELCFSAKEAAEKGQRSSESCRKNPAGAKARTYFEQLTARLKSCPDTYSGSARVFPQPVKPISGPRPFTFPPVTNPPNLRATDHRDPVSLCTSWVSIHKAVQGATLFYVQE
jgi:hypothetical protein